LFFGDTSPAAGKTGGGFSLSVDGAATPAIGSTGGESYCFFALSRLTVPVDLRIIVSVFCRFKVQHAPPAIDMKLIRVWETFPVLPYWARLPGFAAFCGVSVGICAARVALFLVPESDFLLSIPLKLLFAAMLCAGAAGILCRRTGLRTLFFGICGTALFGGSELGSRDFYGQMESIGENHQIMTLTLRISSHVAEQYGGYRFRAKVVGGEDADVDQLLKGRTLQCMSRSPVPAYGVISVQGKYAAPRPAAGPVGYDQRVHFAVNNIHGSFTVSRVLSNNVKISQDNGALSDKLFHQTRAGVHKVINMAADPEARAILHAAFLDEKEYLTDHLNVVFRKSGTIHLLAISGFHSALLYTAVFTMLGLIAIPPRPRRALAIAALWGYLFLIGFIPSLFRSTIMATFFCVSLMLQRKNHVVHTMGISGFFWLLISPHSLFSPGFQLSFAATAGIVLMPQILEGVTGAWISRIRNKPAQFITGKAAASFWMSIAATATTAPSLLYHFGMLSLYGIIYNMIAIPLMSVSMWAFCAALAVSPVDFLARIAVWVAEITLVWITYLAEFSETVPFSEVVIPNTSALQLIVMTVFMVGLCAVAKNLRKSYALRAGAVSMMIFSVSVLMSSANKPIENLEFKSKNSSISVVIHPDNRAWIVAKGRRNEIRNLRVRDIEPLLYMKGVKEVPLFVIDENAEEEAHEFAFSTGTSPRLLVIKNTRGNAKNQGEDGYTKINGRRIINASGACSLTVDAEGRVEISVKK